MSPDHAGPSSSSVDPSHSAVTPLAEERERAAELVAEMLAGKLVEVKPQLDFAVEEGFFYPAAEQALGVKGKQVVSILESLVDKEILERDFFDRIFRCPQCQSVNLRPTTHCPKCGSGNISRGRVFEHFLCKHVGLEEEFVVKGRYVCPKCKVPLRSIGIDYQSLGLLHKCHECDEVFHMANIKWRCLKCSSVTDYDRVTEVNVFSYRLNEERRSWLEFELKPKRQLVEFLKQYGYEVVENAPVRGKSGAEHTVDILASRDDGIITYNIAFGIRIARDKIGLQEIFDFDQKAYDSGIRDKILVVIPDLGKEAQTFANQQRIKVLEVRDLETVLARAGSVRIEGTAESFQFKSKSQLVDHLRRFGYQVEEDALMRGRSGAKHSFDILATRDEGLVTHHIAVGIEVAEKPVGLDKVFDFDDKTYDTGIMNKVIIAAPGLSQEAKQFAERQRIRVFEVPRPEPTN